jgi:hypothetical protein
MLCCAENIKITVKRFSNAFCFLTAYVSLLFSAFSKENKLIGLALSSVRPSLCHSINSRTENDRKLKTSADDSSEIVDVQNLFFISKQLIKLTKIGKTFVWSSGRTNFSTKVDKAEKNRFEFLSLYQ